MPIQPSSPLQMWGGVECTVNRVGDQIFDQLHRSGHRERCVEDLELFAGLGLRTLRTAVNWEHIEKTQSWTSTDALLGAMQRLGTRPIAGLVHHGSGPETTSLLNPEFPEKLADFALKVAQRYPWVRDYTPINEPQTTGRFSCLYGHWFPHHRSMRSYVRALYNQIKGTALAMQAIRSVQPEARLITTEDAGATWSTPQLAPFRFEREHRRWLGTDLLCGLVTRDHPLFDFLTEHGLTEEEVLWFTDNPCLPSVIGLNYYVTSDRFLDHRTDLYPPFFTGGDTGSEPLVDIEAVRVRPEGISSVDAVLQQAWERYRLPVAITEAHLGCCPEEQVRWLAEVWQGAQNARRAGADVRAVTAWALLGSYDWCHLCTRDAGSYEPGVFDISGGRPVPTALTKLVFELAHGLRPSDPASNEHGWWHKPSRLTIPSPVEHVTAMALVAKMSPRRPARAAMARVDADGLRA